MTPSFEDTATLAHDLRIACMRVARRVRFDEHTQVAPHLFSVLVRLLEEPRTVGELASIEQVSAPSMSRSLGQLVDAGYALRAPDEHDGRLVRLSITQEGRALVARERERRDAWMTQRLEGLSVADRAALRHATEVLERVIAG